MGSRILTSLLEKGIYTVTAVTRKESTITIPEDVIAKYIDYTSRESLITALRGQDVLIITMSTYAPPEQEGSLIEAAAEAGVPWVVPNIWGNDITHPGIAEDWLILPAVYKQALQKIKDLGMSYVVFTSGFWYEYSLAGTEARYGFDFKERKVTLFDDGTQKVNTSTWPQIAKAVASFFSFKILPEDENDTSEAVLSRFRNQNIHISSFRVSQRDMLDSVLRVTGTKESDWQISHENSRARFKRGVEMFHKGDPSGFPIQMYARIFYPDGTGDYESDKGLSNKLLKLPTEDLDTCTKGAVAMTERQGRDS